MAVPPPGAPAQITPLAPADLAGVWAIEQTLIGPWTYEQLQGELTMGHGWQLVAKDPAGQVLGYIFGSSVVDEAEIRKVAVAAACRRQGIASRLLTAAGRHLARLHVVSCFLELRASNLAALALYQKDAFQIIGRRRGYYTRPPEDAIILKKSYLPSSTASTSS